MNGNLIKYAKKMRKKVFFQIIEGMHGSFWPGVGYAHDVVILFTKKF